MTPWRIFHHLCWVPAFSFLKCKHGETNWFMITSYILVRHPCKSKKPIEILGPDNPTSVGKWLNNICRTSTVPFNASRAAKKLMKHIFAFISFGFFSVAQLLLKTLLRQPRKTPRTQTTQSSFAAPLSMNLSTSSRTISLADGPALSSKIVAFKRNWDWSVMKPGTFMTSVFRSHNFPSNSASCILLISDIIKFIFSSGSFASDHFTTFLSRPFLTSSGQNLNKRMGSSNVSQRKLSPSRRITSAQTPGPVLTGWSNTRMQVPGTGTDMATEATIWNRNRPSSWQSLYLWSVRV